MTAVEFRCPEIAFRKPCTVEPAVGEFGVAKVGSFKDGVPKVAILKFSVAGIEVFEQLVTPIHLRQSLARDRETGHLGNRRDRLSVQCDDR